MVDRRKYIQQVFVCIVYLRTRSIYLREAFSSVAVGISRSGNNIATFIEEVLDGAETKERIK